ncbi:MAG: hypothetical protein QM723_11255 [Myxococcaceae bacterium]
MERIVRWLLAILIGINAVTGSVSAVMALSAKLGARAHIPTRLLSFYLTLSGWTVAAWLASMVIFAVSIWLLLARKKTLFTYTTAFALDLLVFVLQLSNPDYGLTFTDAHRRLTIFVFVVLTAIGVVIDWLDMRATAPTARPSGRTRPQGPRPAPG